MKGAILAGGLGTRLYPLTYATNKHLLPIYDKPMVFYPIQTLVNAGIKDIIIVTGGPHAGHFLRVLKTGKHLGIRHLEYAYQEKEGGIAEALSLCEDFADKEPLAVILGDNCTDANIQEAVSKFKNGAMVFLKRVPDPQRFGVPVFKTQNLKPKTQNKITPETHQIIKIEEKPKKPKSDYAVTGLYIYDNQVFNLIRKCKPSARGELEITDVNNYYINKGQLYWSGLEGFWSDAGTFDSLFNTATYWAKKKDVNL